MIIDRDSCIRIPLKYKDEEFFKDITKKLYRRYETYSSDVAHGYKKYYHVDKQTKTLMIPRFYDLGEYDIEINDIEHKEVDINITSKVVPRTSQQKESVEYLINNKSGIVCMNPGEGKTVVCIDAICKIGKKAIIFVHKDDLADQWKERFLEHSDITEDRIIRLKTSSHEEDFKKDIVITTVHTFCSMIRNIPDILKKVTESGFGFAVWDECHTATGAETFSKSSLHMIAGRTYGLSATPDRVDGNTDIISMHLGEIFVPTNTKGSTMKPKIIVMKFDCQVVSKHRTYIMHDSKWDRDNGKKQKFDIARYLSLLYKSDNYNKHMKNIVGRISKSARNLIFISSRINILDKCSEYCEDKTEVGFFIPRTNKKESKEEHLKRRLVFSTYGSIRDGTDKPSLDCLIMSTPTSNIKQAIGRIVRPLEGKPQPIVIDIVDSGCDEMLSRYKYRLIQYNSQGWEVEEKAVK